MIEVGIAPIEEADLPDVVRLELDCGLKSGGVERFRRLLPDRNAVLLGAYDLRSSTDPNRLVGFFSGQVVVDELQVDNVAVRTKSRRNGIGLLLIRSALKVAHQLGALTAVLEVRSSNVAAQKLYIQCGFSVAGVRKNYYAMPVEDALTMVCRFNAKT